MIMKYISKIKANITIYASKKTSNILDGSYKSIYKGRTMNFEDLRLYVTGDNIKDIDWKASARSGNLLIRQYIAEKKHNIMLVLDTGKKMLADTKGNEPKKDISIMSAGILAYLANKNGDYVGAVYNKNNLIQYYPFKSTLYNIERILANYESDIGIENDSYIEKALKYISDNIKKRMIIFVITDLEGMESVEDSTLRRLSTLHDVMFVNVSDADMSGDNVYDMEENLYIPKLLLKDNKLHELEKSLKQELYEKCIKRFEKYRISTITVDNSKEITMKIIKLLERHRNANIR